MQWLNFKGYQGVSLSEYLEYPATQKIAITFDDGYEELIDYALPVLHSLNFTATVFIPTHFIGLPNTWDANLDGKTSRHLNEAQLNQLILYHWEIASHSTNHQSLLTMTQSEAEMAMIESKNRLQQICHTPVIGFSYPFGHFNYRLKDLVSRHYKYATAVLSPQNSDLYALPRQPITRWDAMPIFKLKIGSFALPRYLLRFPVWVSFVFTFGTVMLQLARKHSIFGSNPPNTM